MSRAKPHRYAGRLPRHDESRDASITTRRAPPASTLGADAPDDGTDPATAQPAGQDRLLNAAEVALIMGRTLRTLTNWERVGILRPVRISGRRMYRFSDVSTLISDAGQITP